MSGIRGSTSGSPHHPVLPGRRHLDADTDTATERDQQPRSNGHHEDDLPPRASVEEHREIVVRRLLARGLSPTTVATLLPDFRPLVERLAEEE